MRAHDVLLAPLDALGNDLEALVATVGIEEARHRDREPADAAADVEDVRRRGHARDVAEGGQREPAAGGEVAHSAGVPFGLGRQPRLAAAEQPVGEVDRGQVGLAQDPAQPPG